MIAETQLQEWERLANEATSEEWKTTTYKNYVMGGSFRICRFFGKGEGTEYNNFESNAAFIAASRSAMPELIAEIRRLNAILAEWGKFAPFLAAHGMLPSKEENRE